MNIPLTVLFIIPAVQGYTGHSLVLYDDDLRCEPEVNILLVVVSSAARSARLLDIKPSSPGWLMCDVMTCPQPRPSNIFYTFSPLNEISSPFLEFSTARPVSSQRARSAIDMFV